MRLPAGEQWMAQANEMIEQGRTIPRLMKGWPSPIETEGFVVTAAEAARLWPADLTSTKPDADPTHAQATESDDSEACLRRDGNRKQAPLSARVVPRG